MPDEVTKEPLDPNLSGDEIQTLIDLRVRAGASGCQVETEDGQDYLVCTWPSAG